MPYLLVNSRLRHEVLERDRYRCRGCQTFAGELHHIQFRSQGGPDEASNLITLCPLCHRRAHGTAGRQVSPSFLRLMIEHRIWGWDNATQRLGSDGMFVESRLDTSE